jgi:hypothetical protein
MTRPLAVLILTTLPAAAAPALKSKVLLYHPTHVGTTRVYEYQGSWGPGGFREVVTKVEETDGVFRVTYRHEVLGGPATDGEVEVSGKGVFQLRSGLVKCKTPWPVVRLPLRPGDTWESDPSNAIGGAAPKATYTIGGEDVVEVPAGKFRAIRVDSVLDHNGGVVKSSHWYAERIGLIKVLTIQGTAESVQVLKSFTPGM